MIRTAVERLSRYRVVRRRLPARFGRQRLVVSPDAALRFWLPGIELGNRGLLRWVDELVQPGQTVWDVGANVGVFAFAAASRAGSGGHVLAVEADDWLTALLRRSAASAPPGTAPVDVLTAAASEEVGIEHFVIARRGRAGNHLQAVEGSSQAGGAREVRSVITVSLDWLLDRFPPPTLVKIDVEGAEASVLAGARRLLSETRPRLLCEVSTGCGEAVAALLKGQGYRIYDADLPGEQRRPVSRPPWNTLALPGT